MKKTKEKFQLSVWFFNISELLLLISFFVYASTFNVWGHKFSDLPTIHSIILILIVIAMLGWPYIFFEVLSRFDRIKLKPKQIKVSNRSSNIFGNRTDILKTVAFVSIFIDLFFLAAILYSWNQKDKLNSIYDFLIAFLYSTIPTILLILTVGPTTMFSLKIDDKTISHCFLGKHIIRRGWLSNLEYIQVHKSFFPLVLVFRDGLRIRFMFGMQQSEIERLYETIFKKYPQVKLL